MTLERDEDGIWVIECPSIPGCVSQGRTREEALENVEQAIALCREARAEQGLPLTVETEEVEVSEAFYDALVAKEREHEPRETLAEVKEKLGVEGD